MTSPNLQIGDTLIIPGEVPIVEPEIPITPDITYIVQSGDSLYSIAKKYGITVNELKSANNLTGNLLSIGQQLAIPSTEEYITYYVKSGDSLWKIASQFNTTVDSIKSVNNLTSNNLKIGQVLIIP